MRKREEGMMTVEAVLSLVPFIIAVLGIISFINIFAVHNKIQYALYQMTNELTSYTYFYEALGVRSADLGLKADIDAQTQPLDDAVNDIQSFMESIGTLQGDVENLGSEGQDLSGFVENVEQTGQDLNNAVQQGQQAVDSAGSLLRDPKQLLRSIIYLGIEHGEAAAKTWLLGAVSGGLMQVYLDESFSGNNPMTADQYLKYYGVRNGISGLDFGSSQLFNDDDRSLIDIVVEYDIEVYILKLFLKDPTIHVVQRCTAPAWLDGDGVTYSE